jgi:hypothetical protein
VNRFAADIDRKIDKILIAMYKIFKKEKKKLYLMMS